MTPAVDRRSLFLERDTLMAEVDDLKERLARKQGELLRANMALNGGPPLDRWANGEPIPADVGEHIREMGR